MYISMGPPVSATQALELQIYITALSFLCTWVLELNSGPPGGSAITLSTKPSSNPLIVHIEILNNVCFPYRNGHDMKAETSFTEQPGWGDLYKSFMRNELIPCHHKKTQHTYMYLCRKTSKMFSFS